MRSRVLAVLALLLTAGALGLSACGSDESVADPVPKATPDLTVPAGADVLSGNAGATSTTSTTQTTTSSTGTTTTAPGAEARGTTSAAPAQPAPAQTQTPSPGTSGSGGTGGGGTDGGTGVGATGNGDFNEFCQQNPGACPGN